MMASKVKKRGKVDPAFDDVELDELGPPPSTSDLGELFEAERPGMKYFLPQISWYFQIICTMISKLPMILFCYI